MSTLTAWHYSEIRRRFLRDHPDATDAEADEIMAVIKATERWAARGAKLNDPLLPEDFEERH